ncbi:MAG: tetratricopeptide repeat protein [Myxococcota bacterium]
MAKDSNPVVPGKDPASGKTEQPTPGWEKVLYDPKRIEKWVRGEMTLQELHAVSGPEMLELAKAGFSMFQHGMFNDAKVVFEGLNALDPKEAYYLTALGAVHLMLEDLEMAERCFNAAIELDDKEIASYVNRGEVFLRQGKILEAAQDFKKAVELDPENKDPLTQRARILAAAALETLEAAEEQAKNQGKAKKPASKGGAKAAGKKK